MSKKLKKITKFVYTPTQPLPSIGKIKTNWDLKKHFYKNENDPRIERDAATIEHAIKRFAKKYKSGSFVRKAETLAKALKDWEALETMPEASRISRYFGFRTSLNVNDATAQKRQQTFAHRFQKLSNELVFFNLSIGKIPKPTQQKYLKHPKLTPYYYYLKCVFESAKHHLTEPEEKILTLRSTTSSSMWADATEKIISNRTIRFKGKHYHIPEALDIIDQQSWSDKNILWQLILKEMQQISEFAEHELTALVTHAKISDELRHYQKPYSRSVRAKENDEKSVEALIEAISTEGFALSKKFYKLKAKLHATTSIPYVNKYEPIGDLPTPTFEESAAICRDVFYGAKTEYGEIFDTMLKNGQIDVYPRAGKQGGAFMAGTVGLPTFVMLNHTNTLRSLETMAHEMGHAIHDVRSKVQSALYEDFSTTTAETASTFFEQLVLKRVFEQLDDEQKVVFLHDKISRDIATIQRQAAFFNFELKMHQNIRHDGAATKEELAALMQKELKAYLGPAVEVTEQDGYSYVYVPHIRYGFYVYTYVYGHLMSNLMLQKYSKNRSYIEKVDLFLSSGGNDTVENIFKSIGINSRSISTFKQSLETQKEEIKLLETLM